jgi:short-subunit dehydrogenase
MSEIQNKTILLTGAAGGLGKEMAKSFLKEGGRLILSDLTPESLESLELELKNTPHSGRILGLIPADLSLESDREKLYQITKDWVDTPDFLINNAGIAVLGHFASLPKEKWEQILNINLYAPMSITHKFLPGFLKRRTGHIVNVSSVAGVVAVPGLTAYSVSKFGIKAFGEALEQEISPLGIHVTNFYPFFTRTPILQSEQIGLKKELQVPDFLLSEPQDVIRELISGIKKKEKHVYPGGISKIIETLNRFVPGAIQTLNGILLGSSKV